MNETLRGCEHLEKNKNSFISKWGQRHLEAKIGEETYRTNFRRQRDRILYTGGFRRLQDKTQVISAMKSGDHRTRLTHTLEVEQIAISLSDALGLNSDLVSAIAIGHDVGHTPFGHAVERFLNKELENNGGFSHAIQSVRYLSEKIVKKYDKEDITDMQDLIFEGILKHDTDVYAGSYGSEQLNCDKYKLDEAGTLEMQIVYWADKLAYLTHDFEDFYNTDIYYNAKKSEKHLGGDLEKKLKGILENLIFDKKRQIEEDINNFQTRDLIRSVITKLLDQSEKNINSNQKFDLDEMKKYTTSKINERESMLGKEKGIDLKKIELDYIKKSKEKLKNLHGEEKEKLKKELKEIKDIKKNAFIDGLLINFDDEYRGYYKELREILDKHYIFSPEIARSDAKAEIIASNLYRNFRENSKLLPLNIQDRIGKNGSLDRVVADYIASMTDRYAESIYLDLNSMGGNYDY